MLDCGFITTTRDDSNPRHINRLESTYDDYVQKRKAFYTKVKNLINLFLTKHLKKSQNIQNLISNKL